MTQPHSAPAHQPLRQDQARRGNPWRMGPVTAALYASGAALLTVMVFRKIHTPGWYAAALATIVGVALVAAGAGRDRQPRPLSVRSLAYRFAALFVAGQWTFWQIADTSRGGGRAVIAFAAQLVLVAVVAAAGWFAFRGLPMHWAALICVVAAIAGEAAVVTIIGATGGGAIEWLTYAATHTAPLNDARTLRSFLWPNGLLSLGGLTAAFAILGKRFATYERNQDESKVRRRNLFMTTATEKKEELGRLLPEVTSQSQVRVVKVDRWKNGSGETVVVDLSRTNLGGWESLNQYCGTLGSRLRLPNGCGVEADMGVHQGQARLHVSRRNVLLDEHPYPYALRKRSIYDRLDLGVLRPGDPIGVNLRENSMVVCGQKRGGKTMLLRNLLASLGQCDDVLIWVMDFNNGGLALPYLRAWAARQAGRAMIDWVAYDEKTAMAMADVAVAIAKDRKVFYEYLKEEQDINLMPVSRKLPQIMIVMDEGAEVMGVRASRAARDVSERLEEGQRIAGDSGLNTVLSFLRATTQSVPSGVMANSAVRVGMRVTERNELGYLFETWRVNPAEISEQGNGFILPGHAQPVRAMRGYLLTPSGMRDISIQTEQWRPYLDARGRGIGGEIYSRRWIDARHLLADRQGTIHVDLDVDPDAGAPDTLYVATAHGGVDTITVKPAAPAADRPPAEPAEQSLAAADDALAAMRALRERPRVDLADDKAVDQAARDIFGAYDWDVTAGGEPDEPAGTGGVAVAEPPVPAPSAPPAADESVDAEKVLENLILAEGPLGWTKLHRLLTEGGTWGPPVIITQQWMGKLLERAANTYLQPRKDRQPYDHKNRESTNAT